jgi:hypothetical protein
MNTIAQIVDQHYIDFLTVNLVELRHYILHHFHFNHLTPTFPAALVLEDLDCVKQALQLMVNSSVAPYV